MVLSRQAGTKASHVRLGVAKDNVSIPDSIMQLYRNEGTFPINFLLLFVKDFDNPGLI